MDCQRNTITYQDLLQKMHALQDTTYRDFHKKLLKNDRLNLIGVRIPRLRALAKEFKADVDYLLTFPDEYYEITFLKCAATGMLPFGEFCKRVDAIVPLLDNWATCDCFRAPCIKKNREAFLPYLQNYLSDEREFVRRYGLVTLLSSYMTGEYLPLIFQSVTQCGDEPYYVMMAAAWLIAEVLTKFYEEGFSFMQQNAMPVKMHNRAIQKACESYRLSPEQKAQLKKLKR